MTIEKAFAIKAEPAAIWDALWSDLARGETDRFEVEESHWPSGFALRLDLAGLPCRLSYKIERRREGCEVAAKLEPLSRLYNLYQFVTFGHFRRNYELLLVQGLSNLKQSLEDDDIEREHDPAASEPSIDR